jgi:hypothetical protein
VGFPAYIRATGANLSSNPFLGQTSGTISFYVYVDSNYASTDRIKFFNVTTSTSFNDYRCADGLPGGVKLFLASAGGNVEMHNTLQGLAQGPTCRDGSNHVNGAGSISYPEGKWLRMTMYSDNAGNGTILSYVNGAQTAESSNNTLITLSPLHSVSFGPWYTSFSSGDLYIDDIVMSNGQVTP